MDKTKDLYTTIKLQEERKVAVKKAYQEGIIGKNVMSDNLSQADSIIDGANSRIFELEKESKAK